MHTSKVSNPAGRWWFVTFASVKFHLILILSCCTLPVLAQRQFQLERANSLKGSMVDGKRQDWVVGDVVFKQNTTTIYCDSAIFRKAQNEVEAYGRVRIHEGDSVTVTSNLLTYDGNRKIAYLRRNVVFTKLATVTLYTDNLDYDRMHNIARYFGGGKLVDTTNVLTSKKGYYDLRANIASFKGNVEAVNKEYTLKSDTLQYGTKSKTIFFKDRTEVQGTGAKRAIYNGGYYDTRKRFSDLVRGDVQDSTYRLQGDRLLLDDQKKLYRAEGHVILTSLEENTHIHGDRGFFDKNTGLGKVYNRSYVARVDEKQDTLFIAADTLVSIDNKDPALKKLLAYKNVRIFKDDLQGLADSLAYNAKDSVLNFYGDPVLWANGNQMTADSIRILMRKKKIHQVYMVSNSFVVSSDTLMNFNQIKGRDMTVFFQQDAIHHVIVQGNGESIYYALQLKKEEKKKEIEKDIKAKSDTTSTSKTVVTGMNRIICSNMRINFREGKVHNISFYNKPDASFIPPHELRKDQTRLGGFRWRGDVRPTRQTIGGDTGPKSP